MEEKKKRSFIDDEVSTLKGILTAAKAVSIIGMMLGWATVFVNLIYGSLSALICATKSVEQLLANELLSDYLATLNASTMLEFINLVTNSSKVEVIIFDIMLPALILTMIGVIIITVSNKVMRFARSVKTNEELFTREKLNELKEIRGQFYVIFILFIFSFSIEFFIGFMIAAVLMEAVLYLFNYIVEKEIKEEVKEKVKEEKKEEKLKKTVKKKVEK